METVELFGETLHFSPEHSHRRTLVWLGPTIVLEHYQYFDDGATMWSLAAEVPGLFRESHGHATVAEAALHLATILMRESSASAARRIARRLLAGISVELRQGGEA